MVGDGRQLATNETDHRTHLLDDHDPRIGWRYVQDSAQRHAEAEPSHHHALGWHRRECRGEAPEFALGPERAAREEHHIAGYELDERAPFAKDEVSWPIDRSNPDGRRRHGLWLTRTPRRGKPRRWQRFGGRTAPEGPR